MEPRISSAKAPFIHFGFCLHLLFAIKGNLCHLWIPRAFGFGDTCLISLPCLQYRQTYGSTTLQYMILLNDSLWSADNHLSQTQHHQGGTFAGGEAGQAAGHPLVDLVVVASISPHPVVTQQATPWHGVWISTCKGRHRHGCKATAAQLTPAGGKLFQILISLSVRKFNHFKVSFV